MILRPATKADIPAILAIWNPLIRDTSVTFTTEEKTPEGLAADVFKRAGAAPVSMSGSETYGALEKGVIDAADNSAYANNDATVTGAFGAALAGNDVITSEDGDDVLAGDALATGDYGEALAENTAAVVGSANGDAEVGAMLIESGMEA